MINGKEHGAGIQTKTFSFALKITNMQETPSHEFNISRIVMRSAEGQNMSEDFNKKSFFVEKLNPEESKIIEIGKCGAYMHGIVDIMAVIQPITVSITLDLLQKNPFTEEIINIGKNSWIDFFNIRNLNEYKQENLTIWMMILTIMITFFAFLQIVSLFFIEPREQNKSVIRKVNEVDNFNLFVACQTKLVFKQQDKDLLVNYDTQTYKENFDMLNRQPESIRQAIRKNIILMEASNKMMNLLFEQPQKRDEFGTKLINNANQIITNLDIYNEQIIEGECKD